MGSVLHLLARNTVFSAVAFAAVGVVGILLVPFIITAYGLQAYGIVVLGRLFLPGGLLGMLDFGILEVATKRTAQACAHETSRDRHPLGPVLVLALLLGLTLGAVLASASIWIAPILVRTATEEHIHALQDIMLVTALALPLLFAGLWAEGLARGRENFLLVRSTEIIAALVGAAIVVFAVVSGLPFRWVGYAFISGASARSFVLLLWAAYGRLRSSVGKPQPRLTGLRQVLKDGLPFMHSKILGSVQIQLPVLFIGALTGAAGAALFDVIMRLPRFLKSVMALTVSVVFPTSVRLDAKRGTAALGPLLAQGLTITMFVLYPVVSACVVFSREILMLWVGPVVAASWPWMALMFLALSTNTLLSLALTIGSVRRDIQIRANRLFVIQAVFQYFLSFSLYPVLAERAFIVGIAGAMLVFFVPHMKHVLSALQVSGRAVVNAMLRHAAIFAVLLVLAYASSLLFLTVNFAHLLALVLAWCLLFALTAYRVALDDSGRSSLRRLFRALS